MAREYRINGMGVLVASDDVRELDADAAAGRLIASLPDPGVVPVLVLSARTGDAGAHAWDFRPDNPNAVIVVRQRPGEPMGQTRRRAARIARRANGPS
jgi:hypothetical protein